MGGGEPATGEGMPKPSFMLVDAKMRLMNLPELGLIPPLSGDQQFFANLNRQGVVTSVALSADTPFLPQNLIIGDTNYVVVDNRHKTSPSPFEGRQGHIIPTIDYIPKNGDYSYNPKISFYDMGIVGDQVRLSREWSLADGSTVHVDRNFLRTGVPVDETIVVHMPANGIDFGGGRKPEIISVSKTTSFLKVKRNDLSTCPTKYAVYTEEEDADHLDLYYRLYPPTQSKNAYLICESPSKYINSPKKGGTVSETLLSWFIDSIDGEKMIDISQEYLESQDKFIETSKDKRSTNTFPLTELDYENMIKQTPIENVLRQNTEAKYVNEDYVHVSALTNTNEYLTALGIGEVDISFHPKTKKMIINFFSVGRIRELGDAIKLYGGGENKCRSVFHQDQVGELLKSIQSLFLSKELDMHASMHIHTPEIEEKAEVVREATHQLYHDVQPPQNQLDILAEVIRETDPFEFPYNASLTGISSDASYALFEDKKFSTMAKRIDIFKPEYHDSKKREIKGFMENNKENKPIRIFEIPPAIRNDETKRDILSGFLAKKGIFIRTFDFDHESIMLCVNEDTYTELLQMNMGDIAFSGPFSHEVSPIIEGLNFLLLEAPHVNKIYRQEYDRAHEIKPKPRSSFPKLRERYIRLYVGLMIDQLKSGAHDMKDINPQIMKYMENTIQNGEAGFPQDIRELRDSFSYAHSLLQAFAEESTQSKQSHMIEIPQSVERKDHES